jgi:hypothetical protein
VAYQEKGIGNPAKASLLQVAPGDRSIPECRAIKTYAIFVENQLMPSPSILKQLQANDDYPNSKARGKPT